MKFNLIKSPNYLYEALELISQVMELEGDLDLNNIHLSSEPEKFSIPIEELDAKFPDILEYKKRTFSEGHKIFKDNKMLKNINSKSKMELQNLTYFESLFWALDLRDAREVTEEHLLRCHLDSIIFDYNQESEFTGNEKKDPRAQYYMDSTWNEDPVNIELKDIIDLLSKISYEEEFKWFLLEQITVEEKRIELIGYLTKAQEIIESYFYLVEDRFKRSIKDYEDVDYLQNRVLKVFDGYIDNAEEVLDGFAFESMLLSYNSASLKAMDIEDNENTIYMGVLVNELMELTGHFKLNDETVIERCKALGDNVRFEIIRILSERPYYVKELADRLDISSSTLSHHLSILSNNRFLQLEISDRKTYYKINPKSFEELSAYFQRKANSLKEL